MKDDASRAGRAGRRRGRLRDRATPDAAGPLRRSPTSGSSSSACGWRRRRPPRCWPTGVPTSSRSSRPPATRCATCSARSASTTTCRTRRSRSTTAASAAWCSTCATRRTGRTSRSCWPPPTCSSATSGPTRSTSSTSSRAATVARHPRLVYCSVSGYGLPRRRPQPTDLRHRRVLGPFGALEADGRRRGQPAQRPRRHRRPHHRPGRRWPGILAAVIEQRQTGAGRVVEVSLLRTGAYVLGWDLGIQMTLGKVAGAEPRHRNQAPLMNPYRTTDGRWFFFTGLEARAPPAGGVPRPRPARPARRRALRQRRRPSAGTAPRSSPSSTSSSPSGPLDEWAERFEREGVWWAPAQTPAEVVDDPQLIANDGFVEVDGGGRGHDALGERPDHLLGRRRRSTASACRPSASTPTRCSPSWPVTPTGLSDTA